MRFYAVYSGNVHSFILLILWICPVQISFKIMPFRKFCKTALFHSVNSAEAWNFIPCIPWIGTHSLCLFNKGAKINLIILNTIIFFNSFERDTISKIWSVYKLLNPKPTRKKNFLAEAWQQILFLRLLRNRRVRLKFDYLCKINLIFLKANLAYIFGDMWVLLRK